jgi:methylornithine synthase
VKIEMAPQTHGNGLRSILVRAEAGESLSESEIVRFLSVGRGEEQEALFAAARRVRAEHTGNKIFLYGFSNMDALRYRKSHDQVVEAATMLAESGVHLIDLTMGEDPAWFDEGRFRDLADLVGAVTQATDLPVMISPGVVDEEILALFKESGASWYACYQETHDRSLFERIRPGQDFDRRLNTKRAAHRLGLLTEEGLLSGLGESRVDVARSLAAIGALDTDQVRVMSFVPQQGTPLSGHPAASVAEELKIIAILRLLFPDRLIPASLDIGGLAGLKERLDAGANVVTSLVPAGEGLAGVAQSSLDIDDARRSVASVEPVLQQCNLATATPAEYRDWIETRMEMIDRGRERRISGVRSAEC